MLTAAAGALTVHDIAVGAGYYFLPPAFTDALSSEWISFAIPVLILAYIALNAKRGALRRFLKLTALSAFVFGVLYVISLIKGSYLSRYINDSVLSLVNGGFYDGLLHWLTVYLVLSCSCIAVFDTFAAFADMRSESEALKLKSKMILDSCAPPKKAFPKRRSSGTISESILRRSI